MGIKRLDWDSDFFGFEVGEIFDETIIEGLNKYKLVIAKQSKDKELLQSRKSMLIKKIKDSDFDMIVINYNKIVQGESKEFLPILNSMIMYQPDINFGNYWVYKLNKNSQLINTASEVGHSIMNDSEIKLEISYSAYSPFIDFVLQCGDRIWHFPEDGIRFLMSVRQTAKSISVTARRRDISSGLCLFTVKTVNEEDVLFEINVDKSKVYMSNKKKTQ